MSKTRGYLDDLKDNFKVLFNVISDPAYLWQIINDDLILIDYNVAALNFTEGNIKNYVGVKASKFFIDDPETFKALLQSAIERTSNYKEVKYKYKTINAERFLSVNFGFIDPDIILVQTKDITEEKLAAQKLRESEEILNKITDQTFLGFAIFQDFEIKYFNHEFSKIIGYSDEEIKSWKSKEFFKIIETEDKEKFIQLAQKVYSGDNEALNSLEIRIMKKTGEKLWLEIQTKPIIYKENKADMAFIRDITTKKEAENKLKESEEKYRLITENANDLILISHRDSTIEYVNKKPLSKIFGYIPEEIIGKRTRDFIHPDDLGKYGFQTIDYLKKGKRNIKLRVQHKKKYYIPIEISISLFIEKNNEIKQLLIIRDISERKNTEQKLKESEEKYRLIAENANDIISIQDGNFRVEYVNEFALKRILGYSKEELVGKLAIKIAHPEDQEKILNGFMKIFETKEAIVVGRLRHKNGRYIWAEFNGKLFFDLNGKPKFLLITRDITERNLTEQKLRESEEKFRTLTEQSFLGIAILQDNLIKYVNKQLADTFGYSIDETMIWKIGEFLNAIHPEDRQFVAKQAMKKQLGEIDINKQYQFRGIKKNGDIIWLDVFSKTINFGEKTADFVTVLDITERKISEQESKRAYEKLKEMEYIINNSPGIVFLWQNEEDWPVEFVSENIIKMGYSAEEFYSKQIHYADIIHPDDLERITAEIKHYINEKVSEFNQEYRLITKSGEVRWIDDRTWLRRDSTGNVSHLQGIILDITERKKVEEALRESEEKSRLIIENAHDIIYILNKNYKLEYVNEKVVEKLLGYTKQEIIGKSPLKYVHPDDIQRVRKGLSKGFEKGEGMIEVRFKDKKNNYHWFEARGKLFRDIDGNIKSLTIARDMTERKLSEQKLVDSEQKYHEAYDRANFYKDLFAHDIRNVLQIVSSSAELISYQLENSQKSKEIDTIINMIKNQVLRANRMIKNVNILSELETINISIETIELLELLKNSINYVKIAYQDKPIEIKFESFSNRIFIKANELLQDIFDNILINAVKYNNNPEIEIVIRISREQKEDKNYIKMEFIDNGVGIVDDRKEIIFEKGFREHKGKKGMGLGLSLVKKIVTSYNGTIKAEDRIKGDYSKGSNFILLLPESVE